MSEDMTITAFLTYASWADPAFAQDVTFETPVKLFTK